MENYNYKIVNGEIIALEGGKYMGSAKLPDGDTRTEITAADVAEMEENNEIEWNY